MNEHYPELSAFPNGSANHSGIDVRTYVATALASGLLATTPINQVIERTDQGRDIIADEAVKQADALLRRLAK